MITFQSHTDFDFLGDAYAALFAESDATAFQHPIWLDAFYKGLPQYRRAEPLIVTLHNDIDLVGVVPLIRRRKLGFALVESHDLGVTDYAAPVLLHRVRDDAEFADAAPKLFRKALGHCDLLRIRPVREEHLSDWQLLVGGKPLTLDFSAHAVPLEQPMEDWRKAHVERKLSSQYLRKGKRWRKQHEVELRRLESGDKIATAIETLAEHRAGRFEGDPIQSSFVRDFYGDVATRGAEHGFAETWVVASDGEAAAIVFGLTHKGRFLYLLIGADYDRFGRHSPGLQAYDGIIQDWMGRGGTDFDFTIGDEPFKAQFGARPTKMSAFLIPTSLAGQVAKPVLVRRMGLAE